MNAGTGLDRAAAETVAATRWLDVSGVHLEGVVWDARAGRLRFVDIPRGRVFDADLETGAVAWFDLPAPITGVFPTTEDAALLVLDGDGIALVHRGGQVERLAAPLADRPALRMNDGNLDPDYHFYTTGDPAYFQTIGSRWLKRPIHVEPVRLGRH